MLGPKVLQYVVLLEGFLSNLLVVLVVLPFVTSHNGLGVRVVLKSAARNHTDCLVDQVRVALIHRFQGVLAYERAHLLGHV